VIVKLSLKNSNNEAANITPRLFGFEFGFNKQVSK
jgi:hypothetical protein